MRIFINDIRDSGKKKYLLLIPFVVLIVLIAVMPLARGVMLDLMLREKYVEVQDLVGVIADATDAVTNDNAEFFSFLKTAVESMDKLPFIYGRLFRVTPGGLQMVSIPYAEPEYEGSVFDLTALDDFFDMVISEPDGKLTHTSIGSSLGDHEMYCYYRRAPIAFDLYNQYVIVGGVSRHSVITNISAVYNLVNWAMIFIVILAILLMICVCIHQAVRVEKIKAVFLALSRKEGA